VKHLRANHKLLNLYVAEQPRVLERRERDTKQATIDMERRMNALQEKLNQPTHAPVETPSIDDPGSLLF
jgi:hypothetical protein